MVIDAKTKKIIRLALEEDIGRGDITTEYIVSPKSVIKAEIKAKEKLVLCGIDVCREVFKQVDSNIKFRKLKKDGDVVSKGSRIAEIKGKGASVLKAERVALNFLMHLSGVASKTYDFVKIAKKYGVKVLDTRKTIPCLRGLQKYAVRTGRGINHRLGLWHEVMVKENHMAVAKIKASGKIKEDKLKIVIKRMRDKIDKKIEVEVENIDEFKAACRCSPDVILLDNFIPKRVRKAVVFRDRFFPKIKLESSGRVNINNVNSFAKTGVDFISVGSLTHSLQSKDISLKII